MHVYFLCICCKCECCHMVQGGAGVNGTNCLRDARSASAQSCHTIAAESRQEISGSCVRSIIRCCWCRNHRWSCDRFVSNKNKLYCFTTNVLRFENCWLFILLCITSTLESTSWLISWAKYFSLLVEHKEWHLAWKSFTSEARFSKVPKSDLGLRFF